MKAIILAAGQGKRMWPIQKDKCLMPFLGKPLLYHNLKKVTESVKPDEVIIVANSKSKEQIQKILADLGISGTIAVQGEPKGMADAILATKDLIDGEILIVNAEDILDPEIFKKVSTGAADIVFAGLKVEEYFQGGYLEVKGDRVEGIVEKPDEGNEPSDLVKLVVDYFRDGKRLISYLEKATSSLDDVYEVALDQMIADGIEVNFIPYKGVWIPLKYPWQILDVLSYFLSNIAQKISPKSKIAKAVVIEGKVVIEEGAKVFEGAIIKGPAYIGKGVIVGNNTMIRESDLEEGCVIGFSSDITRSYIGANSWFHTNYIGDSVIEGDFGMGSGAVLANLRLDNKMIKIGQERTDTGRTKLGLIAGKGSRVGVNVSIMPGVRVGSNSLVGPGVILREDVKDNTKILVKQEYQISQHTPSLTSYDQFREKLEK